MHCHSEVAGAQAGLEQDCRRDEDHCERDRQREAGVHRCAGAGRVDELSVLLDLYDAFGRVDPTGMDSNPLLRATSDFLQQTSARRSRARMNNSPTISPGCSTISPMTLVANPWASSMRHRTLYAVYERITEQEFSLKRPKSVLE